MLVSLCLAYRPYPSSPDISSVVSSAPSRLGDRSVGRKKSVQVKEYTSHPSCLVYSGEGPLTLTPVTLHIFGVRSGICQVYYSEETVQIQKDAE